MSQLRSFSNHDPISTHPTHFLLEQYPPRDILPNAATLILDMGKGYTFQVNMSFSSRLVAQGWI